MAHILINDKLIDVEICLIAFFGDLSPVILDSIIKIVPKVLKAVLKIGIELMHLPHLLSPVPLL